MFTSSKSALSKDDNLQIDEFIKALRGKSSKEEKTLFECLCVKANYLSDQQEFEESDEHVKRIVQSHNVSDNQIIKDSTLYIAYNLLAYNNILRGNYTQGILYSEKANQTASELNMPLEVVQEYDTQCQIHAISNDFDRASNAYKNGVSILDTISYKSPTLLHLRQRLKSSMALVYTQRAEKLFLNARSSKSLDLYRKSANLLNEVISQKETVGTKEALTFIESYYANLGGCYYRLSIDTPSLLDSATYFYQKAITIFNADSLYATHPVSGIINISLGTSLIHKTPQKATELIQQGLKYTGYYPTTTARDQISMFEKAPMQDRLISAISSYAGLYLSIYRKTNDISNLNKSFNLSKEAITHMEYLAVNQLSSQIISTKRSLLDLSFLNGIEAAILLYEETGNLIYFNEAFSLMEKRKSFVLRQAVKNKYTQLANSNSRKSDFLEKELELDKRYRDLQQQKLMANASGDVLLRDSLVDLLCKHMEFKQEFIDQLKGNSNKENLSYYKDRYDNTVPDLTKIKEKYLHKNKALISYSFGGIKPVALIITIDTQFVVRFSLDEKFWNNFDRMIKCQQLECAEDEYSFASTDVYKNIFKDIHEQLPDHINELLITPDNELRKLSFDYLPTSKSNMHFLIQQYAIAINYSIGTLEWIEQTKQLRPKKNRKKIAAFIARPDGENQSENGCSATALPYLGKSAEEMLRFFPKNEQVLFAPATVSDFINNAKDFDILHIVAHGCMEEKNGMNHYLQFAPDAQDKMNGRLSKKRIQDTLVTNAKLVTFASCKTNSGILEGGEGLASICRTFVQSGAEQMLVTLNNINDFTSGKLLLYFYEELIVKEEKTAIALAKAKRRFLANPDIEAKYKSPNYWCNFVLIGNGETH